MISNYDLQQAYNDLYSGVREYIWEYDVIDALADLEIAVYSALPDLETVKRSFDKLCVLIRNVVSTDETLKEAVDNFADILDSADTTYYKLTRVNEVMQV